MTNNRLSDTLLLPQKATPTSSGRTRTLSTEIMSQGARRLRVSALLYAFTFFMSGFLGSVISPRGRAEMAVNPHYWYPDVAAILMALLVAALTRSRRIALPTIMNVGLVFLVASNYGIAIAEYLNPIRLDNNGWIGLSWVAVWTPLYAVAVPTPPRKALLALLASITAVPVVVGFMIATGRTVFRPDPGTFFVAFIFPYLLIVILGYVTARVVYDLGAEVTRARDLGSYHLVERLGQGGMGEVWRAKHRLLARPAAIKLIKPSLTVAGGDAGNAVRRFEREAQITAQLRSPHTVALWDFGAADDGSFYYVMELLDGFDLQALVERYGPVPAERAIFLVRQMCHSLAEAETKGLVHRDIKPGNIFVCRYGVDFDFVKVLDFGIAKALDVPTSFPNALLTGENVLRGTPAFIAPEQALGAASVDSRADIYATGCVAYWLLTGELVFTADTVMGVLLHHAHTPPTAPSARSELPIPPELDAVILSCLAKNPADRPGSAAELSQRLAAIALARPWNDDRAREWWNAHQPEPRSASTSGPLQAS
jgi:serine/threonine-protein kinase